MSLRHRRRRSLFFGGSDAYAVGVYKPNLVFDFASEYYRTVGALSTFNDSLTYTGASAKTMVDSDGLVKWAPHNLLTYSEAFDNAAWSKANCTVSDNAAVAPDGESTADNMVPSATTANHSLQHSRVATSLPHTAGLFVKANGYNRIVLYNSYGSFNITKGSGFDLTAGTVIPGANSDATITDVGNGWYFITTPVTSLVIDLRISIVDASWTHASDPLTYTWEANGTSGIYIWGAHLYRSDLGGMVDNPDRGDSYVPTTSAAVYLPRRGHHIYNGNTWVNEGILLESEARTNLFTYSNEPGNAIWTPGRMAVTDDGTTGLGGEAGSFLCTVNVTGAGADVRQTATVSTGTTYTVWGVFEQGTWNWIALDFFASPTDARSAAWINLADGTLGTSTGSPDDYGATLMADGRWLVWMTVTTVLATSTFSGFFITDADGSFSCDDTDSVYCYHLQLEAGSTPSSYIPTSGATVTRSAETLTVAAANLPYSSVNMSMQMDGEITYADENTSGQAALLRWDGGNDIYFNLVTNGSFSGGVTYRVYNASGGGTGYAAESTPGSYAPGINVSFNIAGRTVSSSASKLAVDGSIVGTDAVPPPMPDLSATNMQLGYDYMGTIGKFRMWDEDLGDTGIATASARTYTTEFAMIVATTTPSETFTIPCQNVGTFNAGIDWGDGQVSTITAYNDAALTHTYAAAGDHVIRITGTFPNIYFNNAGDKLKVKSVENLGVVGWTRLNRAFFGCTNMTSFTAGTTDTSAVTAMDVMFYNCTSLTALDVSSFNTAAVTTMASMFYNCSSLTTLDASSFNTALVTNTNDMFHDCSSLTTLDVSSFNTALVTNMNEMFRECSSVTVLDVSGFNTALVTNMTSMFNGCSSLTALDVSSFNTAAVTSMNGMFYNCSSVTALDVSGFNTAAVTAISSMFRGCSSLTTLDVSSFNTALVTNMNNMFHDCSSLTTLDVSSFNTALVTDMSNMFRDCSSLTVLDVSSFNTAAVTTMSGMFYNCSSVTDIVGVDTFDIGGLDTTSDLNSFATSVTLPTARYDALLIAWEAQDPFDGMAPNFGSSTYTGGGAVATARASLISRDGWTITDGGIA